LAPFAELAGAIDGATDMVAFSAVQSADGALADLDAIAAAAEGAGAMTVVDATQACGWLPIDATRFDVVVCSGYKWLMGPRGTAYMSVRPERWESLRPVAAGWYAGESPVATLYDGPLRLAPDARRFDVSPAWHAWVGAVAGLELLLDIGVEAVHAHDVALAGRLRAGLGLPPAPSAILAVDAGEHALGRLQAAGVMAAGRGGRLRLATHLYSTVDDVDRALEALAGVRPAAAA
jgi:selenocysteine lyase/cysteine desulfurase